MLESQTGRVLGRELLPSDEEVHRQTVRPSRFEDYPGQERVKQNLQVYVNGARSRNEALDHVLLHGPPGLGKTTLARIIAHELGVSFYQSTGPSIEKPGDLAGLLTGIDKNSVLFIDEIHRLNISVEEILYAAMEDFSMDILVGQGPTARSINVPINQFTLIGATTRMSLISAPLRSRFGIQERLEYYSQVSLEAILDRSARIWGLSLSHQGASELAKRSRGTPRIANRLLRRARDFCVSLGSQMIDECVVQETLRQLDIDERGLDRMDRCILDAILNRYDGGPVGLGALAASIGEERTTIEDVYEPFLVHQGFIRRGPRGREISREGREHLLATQFVSVET